MDWLDYTLLAVAVFCIACPPKYDPAIRAKVRREQKAGRWPKDD